MMAGCIHFIAQPFISWIRVLFFFSSSSPDVSWLVSSSSALCFLGLSSFRFVFQYFWYYTSQCIHFMQTSSKSLDTSQPKQFLLYVRLFKNVVTHGHFDSNITSHNTHICARTQASTCTPTQKGKRKKERKKREKKKDVRVPFNWIQDGFILFQDDFHLEESFRINSEEIKM
jgi:hypothetical protein